VQIKTDLNMEVNNLKSNKFNKDNLTVQ